MDFFKYNFLFIFFPVVVIFFFVFKPIRKWLILTASIVFYFFNGDIRFLFILILSSANYLLIRLLSSNKNGEFNKLILWIGVIGNLLVLVFFKIFSGISQLIFPSINSNPVLAFLDNVPLPLGLSFIVFQILSCLIDTYRDPRKIPRGNIDYLTYLFFFPKILSGPITKYGLFENQLYSINTNWGRTADGLRRFIKGLAKKVLIADQIAVVVDSAFGLAEPSFSTGIAWFVLISFFIQIYYDFSGYIDMALGIAQIFGIDLPENFNKPYRATSVSDFWRRWHITLQTWFRDYVFYPLEFKRRKVKFFRVESHVLLVFFLTGLWHGITLNYILWGLLQGFLIILENSRFGKWLKKMPSILQHGYLIIVVLIGWVFFRSPNLFYAIHFFKRLVGLYKDYPVYPFQITQPIPIINNSVIFSVLIGLIFLFPVEKIFYQIRSKDNYVIFRILNNLLYLIALIASIAFIANQEFIPSIYGQF